MSNCSAHSASNLTVSVPSYLHVRAPATFPGLVISHNCLLKTYHCPTCVCIWVHAHVLATAQLEISRNETLPQPASWSSFWLLLHNCTVLRLCWSTGPDTDIRGDFHDTHMHTQTHRHTAVVADNDFNGWTDVVSGCYLVKAPHHGLINLLEIGSKIAKWVWKPICCHIVGVYIQSKGISRMKTCVTNVLCVYLFHINLVTLKILINFCTARSSLLCGRNVEKGLFYKDGRHRPLMLNLHSS